MKIVMVFGTFDILHLGHLYVFKQARKYGDCVIAVVARDKRVKKIKKLKPIHNENERRQILKHVNLIDKIVLGDKLDVYKPIKKYKPDTILLGYDQKCFVEGLEWKIKEYRLNTKIIRLKPYKPEQYKTGKIRKHLEL